MARETAVAGASVVLCGHTHVPRLFRLKNGRFVVNPGSVGLPGYEWDVPAPHVMEVGTPHTRYLIMDRVRDTWRFDFRALSYDWHAAAAMADKRGSAWSRVLATGFVK